MSEKSVSARQRRAQETRQQLLEAGYAVFMEQGFQKATITQIIKQANKGYGTAYVYFQNKDQLFIEVMEDVMRRFYQVAELPFYPASAQEAYEQIKHQTRLFLQLALKEKRIMQVVKEAIGLSPLVAERWQEIRQRFVQRISRDIAYAQEHGLAKPHLDPALIARAWFYANEMFMWELVESKKRPPLEQVVHHLTALYTGGLYLDPPQLGAEPERGS